MEPNLICRYIFSTLVTSLPDASCLFENIIYILLTLSNYLILTYQSTFVTCFSLSISKVQWPQPFTLTGTYTYSDTFIGKRDCKTLAGGAMMYMYRNRSLNDDLSIIILEPLLYAHFIVRRCVHVPNKLFY